MIDGTLRTELSRLGSALVLEWGGRRKSSTLDWNVGVEMTEKEGGLVQIFEGTEAEELGFVVG